jgi:hypothetical protein
MRCRRGRKAIAMKELVQLVAFILGLAGMVLAYRPVRDLRPSFFVAYRRQYIGIAMMLLALLLVWLVSG